MEVKIIKCLQDNYSYLIIDKKTDSACVIDPSEAEPIIENINKTKTNLKFILNTHHHHDHIGGNNKLKKMFNAKVMGFKGDKDRIPNIDILVDNNEVWKYENFEIKILHIPGHTSGHICFYFFKENIAFTGDTLFSLGCGRVFEGTHEEMFDSLNKLKKLPTKTKIYCGHEYTLKNSLFCIEHDRDNEKLKKKIQEINYKCREKIPTVPTTLEDELACNIFLRAKSLQNFSKLRDLKDNY